MRDIHKRVGERSGWFRVGVVSATLLTPLATRWQTLRAAERARALWEASHEATWPWARKPTPEQLTARARSANVSAGLWLTGVGVGLVLAGTGAYVIMRRRMAALEDEPLELRIAGDGEEDQAFDGGPRTAVSANGNVEAPAVLGGEAHTSLGALRTNERIGTGRPGSDAAAAARGASARETSTAETPSTPGEAGSVSLVEQLEEVGAPTTLENGAPAGVGEPERASFIGNVRTLVYHEAGDENLPAEENRVYFASREEAEEAGFRPDQGEAPAL